MDIHEIRQLLKMKSIYDIPLSVTYYARVSSESDEQLNSLSNQIQYYEELIRKNPAWTFVDGYIDEGLSGISTKKRENFNRMIEDAKNGKFDFIITKEISRFARNTLDSIQYTRQLLNAGVGVFFQNDNINTLDEDSELRLSIMSSIAQDELRKLSSRIKFGHQQAIKQNVVLGNNRIFGYKKKDGKLIIDEEQVDMVRELFELYATDKYSMKQIEKLFWDKGYRNYNGKKIYHTTMSNVISNPKYKGYYVGNKVKVIDMFTKKQKFLPPEEWVMFKDETGDIVPAIVSEELWERANIILRRRSEDVKNRQGVCNHPNLLTGKMYCANCGTLYYRRCSTDRKGNKNSKWICSGKINNGKDSCASLPLYEEELKPLIFEVFKDTQEGSKKAMEEYEKLFLETICDNNIEQKITEWQAKIELALKKRSKLLELVATEIVTPSEFKSMTVECNEEIKAAERRIAELQEKQHANESFKENMNKIRETLRKAETDCANGEITKEFVNAFIDKIVVTPQEDGSMKLDVKIYTGETCEKFLTDLRAKSRTGHTFKKIWPIQTAYFPRQDRTAMGHTIQVKYSIQLYI